VETRGTYLCSMLFAFIHFYLRQKDFPGSRPVANAK
jgi:hypothetical protein